MDKKDFIRIRGARAHNLKNVSIDIPRDKFVVVTGISGSGKSSLAFDTLYAEGQRRYVESLSAYARQFLGQMDKPEVESIEGLSPSISIDQKTTNRNPRSTVGTVTEIYDYLRLLYARVGTAHCPICDKPIEKQSIDQIVDKVLKFDEGTKLQILAPSQRGAKGTHKKLFETFRKDGFVRVIVDGELYELSDEIELDKNKKHDVDLVIDRIVIREGIRNRLTDSIEIALEHGNGLVKVSEIGGEETLYSTKFSCAEHGSAITEMEPRIFSFNAPYGACELCKGLGEDLRVDIDLLVPDDTLSYKEGAITSYSASLDGTYYSALIESMLADYGVTVDTPFKDYPEELKEELFYGTGSKRMEFSYKSRFGNRKRTYRKPFEGIVNNLERRRLETNSDVMRAYLEKFMSITPCQKCNGARLKPEVLAVKVGGISIIDLTKLSVRDCAQFLEEIGFDESKGKIAEQILKEIKARLRFLNDVGLGYLNLSRSAGTLSGGESQRIRLATQIGSALCGVLYILDEPSIGLHQKDNDKLLKTLRELCDIGNSLIVVEHDEDTIRFCDHIIDMGVGAGEFGGSVVAAGSLEDILKSEESLTGQYLSGRKAIEVPKNRRRPDGRFLSVKGARANNLRNIDVDFPIGLFTAVTGVSGSGKSSLVNEVLFKGLTGEIKRYKTQRAGLHDEISGAEAIDKIIEIDQSPIGRTPRSNPATYTKVFDKIRDLFAALPAAKQRGYQKGRFSFNVKGGRCESCSGDGLIKVEMHFLPDVYVPCEVCGGKRYNKETLEVRYKGKNIAEVLDMTVHEAYEFFEPVPAIRTKMETLMDVGLSYIKLGQSSTELSGGEAQRIKLASELSKRSTGSTLYILDEPTTGLHIADVHKLVKVLDKLTEQGNTIIVIEHNLDLIKCADYIIDLGPDGGDGGGKLVAVGSPEEIVKEHLGDSYTAQFLERCL
ncbi:MAG: excinuclease ABC subunit UvrA [Bacillota bacterium]|nr:excinuclease ABC subunit UvrA [Bacillota bacterium]